MLDPVTSPLPGDRLIGRGRVRRVQLTAPGFVTYITEGQANAHSKRISLAAWWDWCERSKATPLTPNVRAERLP